MEENDIRAQIRAQCSTPFSTHIIDASIIAASDTHCPGHPGRFNVFSSLIAAQRHG